MIKIKNIESKKAVGIFRQKHEDLLDKNSIIEVASKYLTNAIRNAGTSQINYEMVMVLF